MSSQWRGPGITVCLKVSKKKWPEPPSHWQAASGATGNNHHGAAAARLSVGPGPKLCTVPVTGKSRVMMILNVIFKFKYEPTPGPPATLQFSTDRCLEAVPVRRFGFRTDN